MKLWNKGYTINNIVDQFTVGNDRILDLKLAKHDVAASAAHAKMLATIGLLSDSELNELLHAFEEIMNSINNGEFIIEDSFEDVHSKIEFILTQKYGDTGKKIHTARSRNDQVLVALHLYAKEELVAIKDLIKPLFETLISLSNSHKEILIPGYTHLQVAMPSSFGIWFSAYAESLVDDLIMLNAALEIADQNPLGSAAGYGSSFPINRTITTDLLEFKTLKYNVVAAQMSRGKLEKTIAFALSSVASTLSKFSSDICLYMSQNFGFISFPKELTTGSSIMPHKQNPDVFELIRAKCNKIQNLPAEIMAITNNLTSGYHRDFQLLKESLMTSIDETKDCLEVTNFMLQHIIVNKNVLDNPIYENIYSVENLNHLVMDGMNFRDAYQFLAKEIANGSYKARKDIKHTHEGSIGNLCLNEIKDKFNNANQK